MKANPKARNLHPAGRLPQLLPKPHRLMTWRCKLEPQPFWLLHELLVSIARQDDDCRSWQFCPNYPRKEPTVARVFIEALLSDATFDAVDGDSRGSTSAPELNINCQEYLVRPKLHRE